MARPTIVHGKLPVAVSLSGGAHKDHPTEERVARGHVRGKLVIDLAAPTGLVLRTGNTVSTESVIAPWSLGARSERTRRVRERRVTTRAGDAGPLECERIYGEVHLGELLSHAPRARSSRSG